MTKVLFHALLRGMHQVLTSWLGLSLLLIGWWWRRLSTQKHVVVLGYHSVSDSVSHIAMPTRDFTRQMSWLRRSGVPVLSLQELQKFLCGKRDIDRDAVVITFDDCFYDNFSTAGPILEQFGLRSAFFVPTGHVGKPYIWDGEAGSLRERVMTWEEMRALSSRGHEIGSHLVTHRGMSSLSSEERKQELRESGSEIARYVGYQPIAVAFPYGDCGAQGEGPCLLSDSGYQMALTTKSAVAKRWCNPRRVPRYMVDRFSGRDPFTTFVLYLTCLYGTFQWYERAANLVRRACCSPAILNKSGGSS